MVAPEPPTADRMAARLAAQGAAHLPRSVASQYADQYAVAMVGLLEERSPRGRAEKQDPSITRSGPPPLRSRVACRTPRAQLGSALSVGGKERSSTSAPVWRSMSVLSLAEWHSRLDQHFVCLREERDKFGQGRPLFALEHGLNLDEELPRLGDAVRASVAGGRLPAYAWLPFVVYAAEVGYRYQGDEYWPVFEADTPHWRARGGAGRLYIRKKYEMFAKAYGGATPSGAWAAWFKNIAWPITHAILPTDLQRHLARLLYDYRSAYTAELLDDHEALGQRLAYRCDETSARFRKFAENSSLLGLVAASLLLGDEEETPLLMQSVLHRILVDLSHERQAGVWLRDAKKAAVRVRRRGFLSGQTSDRTMSVSTNVAPVEARWPRLEVDLSLRRTSQGWTGYVSVPSHESLAYRFPELRGELERVRYHVEGVEGVQPRGALMYRQGPLALTTWPTDQRSIVAVEGGSVALRLLLADHCRFPVGPWVFKIREPGMASEVRTTFVRPGADYFLLGREQSIAPARVGDPVQLATSGVQALRLRVPPVLDESDIKDLRQLGVGVVSDLAVWPAGLVPASWDGEGRATWPAGESPVVGIHSSRSAAKCVVSTEVDVAEFPWPQDSDVLFVQLRNLDTGSHAVDVALLEEGTLGPIAEGRLLLGILEPADSAARAGARQGLQVHGHPSRPSLEELWTGSAAIVATGPQGEKVNVDLVLMNRGGRKTLARAGFSSALPITDDRWRELLRGVQGSDDFWLAYDDAEEMKISVSNLTLGRTDLTAGRPFSPLRWCVGRDRAGPYARLIDHLGSDDMVIEYFDAPRPAEMVQPEADDEQRIRTANGGLVLARASDLVAAVVLPPHISGGLESLRRLSVRPSIQTGPRSGESVVRMIEVARLWTRVASPADENARHLQSQVNDTVVAMVGGMVGGGQWKNLEHELLNGREVSEARLLGVVGHSHEERRVAGWLLRLSTLVGSDPSERAVAFAQVLSEYASQASGDLADSILRLATVPGSVTPEDPIVAKAIAAVLQWPFLYRLARLFVVALANNADGQPTTLRGWQWE